jgi:hypothetical protein
VGSGSGKRESQQRDCEDNGKYTPRSVHSSIPFLLFLTTACNRLPSSQLPSPC